MQQNCKYLQIIHLLYKWLWLLQSLKNSICKYHIPFINDYCFHNLLKIIFLYSSNIYICQFNHDFALEVNLVRGQQCYCSSVCELICNSVTKPTVDSSSYTNSVGLQSANYLHWYGLHTYKWNNILSMIYIKNIMHHACMYYYIYKNLSIYKIY